MTLMSFPVAPASRSEAYRSSRRADASLVAVPIRIRIRIGNRNASAAVMNASLK
jgi:hypothetical protein